MEAPYASIPWNFAALPEEFSSYESAGVAILPIPYDATTCYGGGARGGPQAVIEASRNMELFDLELEREPFRLGIATLPEMERDSSGPEAMMERIYEATKKVLSDGKFLVSIGGEHSVTLPLVRAHREICPSLSVLSLDAHLDLRDSYEGSRWSHACVTRRLVEMGLNVVCLGARTASTEEFEFAKASGFQFFSPETLRLSDARYEATFSRLSQEVYLTVDLDVFDPAFLPAVGTPEPGGLTWQEVISILRTLARERTVRGFDVVELAPIPGQVVSQFLAAKLIYKALGYFLGR